MDFTKFEAVWQAVWAYIYKVLEYFGIEGIEPVA